MAPLNLEDASPEFILFVIALTFFVGCMFVDSLVVLLILTPIFMPIVDAAGIDPILVGVMVTLQMAIGSAAPFPVVTSLPQLRFSRHHLYGSHPRNTAVFPTHLDINVCVADFLPSIALLPRDILFN